MNTTFTSLSLLYSGLICVILYFKSPGFRRLQAISRTSNKYRDSYLFAVHALQTRLYDICEKPRTISMILDGPPEWKQDIVEYTCYLLGCYLAWGSLWRRDANVLGDATNDDNKARPKLSSHFNRVLSTPTDQAASSLSFCLPPGSICAISQLMIDQQGAKDTPLEFPTFLLRWNNDPSFQVWFQPWKDGLIDLAKSRSRGIGDQSLYIKLRKLQHILVKMVRLYDPKGNAIRAEEIPMCGGKVG